MKRAISVSALSLMGLSAAFGQVVYTGGGAYTQNFDTLANTGTVNWTDNSTITGWYASQATYIAGTGSGTTGAMYSFGATSSTDRALGSVASNSLAPVGSVAVRTGARFTNAMGGSASAFNLQYVGEQWRNGGNTTQQSLTFEYSLDATSLTSGTWTAVTALDFVGPIATATAGALDGNAAANRVLFNQNVTLSSSWSAGSDLWIRWNDLSDSGNDHGLGIDQVSFSSSAPVPEPATMAVLGVGALALLRRRNRKA